MSTRLLNWSGASLRSYRLPGYSGGEMIWSTGTTMLSLHRDFFARVMISLILAVALFGTSACSTTETLNTAIYSQPVPDKFAAIVIDTKTGKTLYYQGQAFQSLKGRGYKSNYFDVATGDEYWISGVRNDRQDRLYGSGLHHVAIDDDAKDAYAQLIEG